MGLVYLVRVKIPSESAKRIHGYGWTRKILVRMRMRSPETEEGLFDLFYPLVRQYLPCRVGIIRNNAKGEQRGFKSVVYGQMNHRTLEIMRRGRAWPDAINRSYHKPLPVIGGVPLPQSRQPEWARSDRDEHYTVRKPSLEHFRNRIKEAEANAR